MAFAATLAALSEATVLALLLITTVSILLHQLSKKTSLCLYFITSYAFIFVTGDSNTVVVSANVILLFHKIAICIVLENQVEFKTIIHQMLVITVQKIQ